MILITGASGQYARLAAEQVLRTTESPSSLLLVTRSPSKLQHFVAEGVVVRQGSFDDSLDALTAVFAGAKIMLLIATSKAGGRLEQHQRAIDAAKDAGVSHIVYTSFVGIDVPHHSALVVQEHKETGL